MAETSYLLRKLTIIRTEGSNPSLSAIRVCVKNVYARVAQLDRVPGYEPGGRRFESFHAHHFLKEHGWIVLVYKKWLRNIIPFGRRFDSCRAHHIC